MTYTSQKGFTLVETLVSIGILSLLLMGVAAFVVYQKNQVEDQIVKDLQSDYIEQIEDAISAPDTCKAVLRSMPAGTFGSAIAAGQNLTLDTSLLNRQFSDIAFVIQKANLSVDSNLVGSIDLSATDLASVYNANFTLELNFTNTNTQRNYILKKLVIPIKIYGEPGKTLWRDLKCSSTRSETAMFIGQVCNLYGGLMSDGVHCDFPKVKAVHLPTTENTNVPVEKMNINSDRVQRVSMPEMVCYIDTLTTLTKTLPGWTNTNNYTRFCRYPGSGILSSVSRDLKNSRYPNLQ